MQTAGSVVAKRGIQMIASSASVDEARQMIGETGVDWLGVCRAGVLIGIIDVTQLILASDTPDLQIGTLTENDRGRAHWLD